MRTVRSSGAATIREEYFDAEGRPVMDWFGFHSRVLSLNAEGHLCFSGFNEDGKPVNGLKGYHQWICKRDEKGRERDIEWYRTDGKPSNANGCARKRLTYNSSGINSDVGLWVALSDGSFCLRERWESNAHLLEYAFFTTDDRHAAEDGKVHRVMFEYDAKGNFLAERNYAVDGAPVNSLLGYHMERRRYNDKGKPVEDAYFDVSNQPDLRTDEKYHRRTATLNSDGRLVEEAFYRTDGKPITAKAGYSLRRWTYSLVDQIVERQTWIADSNGRLHLKERKDGKDRVLEDAIFTKDGEPRLGDIKVHRWIHEYDAKGKYVLQRVLGTRGEPVNSTLGIHLWKGKYDDGGNLIEVTVFGADGKPAIWSEYNYHRQTQKYNDQKKELERAYFGTQGEPINMKDGYTRREWSYGSDGKLTQYTNWIVTKEGKVAITLRTDHRNFVLEEAHFNSEGKATIGKEGNHRTFYEYDEFNYRKVERYFGADGKPALNSLGFHWTHTIRNAEGRWIDHKVYGIDDKPTTSKEGIHHWVWRLDDKNKKKVIELRYFGTDEKPVDSRYGYARREYLYDDKDRWKDTIPYDSRGNRLKWDMSLSVNPVPGSAGAKAGLRVNDVVKRLAGEEASSPEYFTYLCETEVKEGKTLKLEILRGGMPMTLELPHGSHGVSFRTKPIPWKP